LAEAGRRAEAGAREIDTVKLGTGHVRPRPVWGCIMMTERKRKRGVKDNGTIRDTLKEPTLLLTK
jgi:hypothetical protein